MRQGLPTQADEYMMVRGETDQCSLEPGGSHACAKKWQRQGLGLGREICAIIRSLTWSDGHDHVMGPHGIIDSSQGI
ncbi:hypothetical protein AMATHDRAFT_66192 [Amanita thiersii Skay4041]|uniref:Uncharacterized protein n=1 Tax=Amanita thiersii Skay4041 TaxID=703135 RepID=A0A2A9NKB8_9AGAR|nr:hypothetical protein AMATHDRAFT_66192 [Amanita thiersii Skay4041]